MTFLPVIGGFTRTRGGSAAMVVVPWWAVGCCESCARCRARFLVLVGGAWPFRVCVGCVPERWWSRW